MNIFDCAIKMEEEARVHYDKLSAEATVPELKTIFGLLASSEKEHYDSLVKMRDKSASTAAAEFKALNDAACAFRPLLGKCDLMAELKHDPDGYRFVVKEEEASIRFYEDLAAKADTEETRKLLLALADEEKRHLSIVENIYSFVESPRTYLAWGEFSNLKEF